MSMRHRLFRRAAAVALTVAGSAMLLSPAGDDGAIGRTSGGDAVLISTGKSGGQPFAVSGTVTGLFPGSQTNLVVTVTNNMPFTIVVTQVTVVVGDASRTCPSGNLLVAGFSGAQPIPGKGTGPVILPVAMSHAAGDACQGAVFPLQYTATATRAGTADVRAGRRALAGEWL
jgi:hypothetical protein